MNKLLLSLFLCLSHPPVLAGDLKKEMLAAMDSLCQGGPAAEAALDWDNLQFRSPALTSDLNELYSKVNANEKAGFRQGFLASFAQAFKAHGQGQSFSSAALIPGRFIFITTGDYPSLSALGPPKLRVEFRRLKGRLLITKMLIM